MSALGQNTTPPARNPGTSNCRIWRRTLPAAPRCHRQLRANHLSPSHWVCLQSKLQMELVYKFAQDTRLMIASLQTWKNREFSAVHAPSDTAYKVTAIPATIRTNLNFCPGTTCEMPDLVPESLMNPALIPTKILSVDLQTDTATI